MSEPVRGASPTRTTAMASSPTRPLKVLHVHPKIGIGGVETYLCRLLGEMQRRGHETGLVTAGGVYECRVTEGGARLFKLPVRKENVERATEMVRPYGFELIHAHNYKAARLGRRLAQRLGAAFLMSVHGPRPVWHRILFRDWSRWVVAMSEGDRDNITSFGGISRDRVLLSFYGIDTDRFRPALETAPLFRELGLLEEALPVVYVSRFAHDKARVAVEIIEAMPQVCARAPQAVLLLVGEGPAHERLQARGEEVNRSVGRTVVRMVGPRQDVERIMNVAAVVVATANTALEAMACATPTLAAGRSGYFGEVTPANFEEGRAVCFGDHGRLPRRATQEQFARDIGVLLADRGAAARTAQGNRGIVAQRYTVQRMAESVEAIYLQVLGKAP